MSETKAGILTVLVTFACMFGWYKAFVQPHDQALDKANACAQGDIGPKWAACYREATHEAGPVVAFLTK